VGSITTLVCYYGAGLPLALYLGFNQSLGVKGFWIGYLIAMVILNFILGFVVIFADWSPKINQTPELADENI